MLKKLVTTSVGFALFFTSMGFAYDMSTEDLAIVDDLTQRVETVIESKGDGHRAKFVTTLRTYALVHNERIAYILLAIADNLEQKPASSLIYQDFDYGFTIAFPLAREGYMTKHRELSRGYGTSDSIDFGFEVQDSLFNISIHTLAGWEALQTEEGPKPTYLGETDMYVFGFAQAQYNVDEQMAERMDEVVDIVQTFTIIEE